MFFIDWKQNKKQDKKQSKKLTKNKTNIETERQKHTPWKQSNNRKRTNQKWKQPGFKKGMLGKFVSKKQANIRKWKGKKKKNKRNPK